MADAAHGVVVIDKPSGITSHDVVARVRRACGTLRVGHAGTLDPLATGVLPLVVGVATRLVSYLPADPKVYAVTARLGVSTTTGDADGDPIGPAAPAAVSVAELERALLVLLSRKEQVPPMFSAKKVDGRRLYRSARAGIEVERRPIPITIHRLVLTGRTDDDVSLEVHCGPGTYVRSLVVDLGTILGCGASVRTLRRLRSGAFSSDDATPLAAIESADDLGRHLVPLDEIPVVLPSAVVTPGGADRFRSGGAVEWAWPPEAEPQPRVAVRREDGRLLGVADVQTTPSGTLLKPRIVLAI